MDIVHASIQESVFLGGLVWSNNSSARTAAVLIATTRIQTLLTAGHGSYKVFFFLAAHPDRFILHSIPPQAFASMRFAHVSLIAMLPTISIATCGTPYTANSINGTLLYTVVLDMGNDAANVTASQYDPYFSQGNALEGVEAVIASGSFYISKRNLFREQELTLTT